MRSTGVGTGMDTPLRTYLKLIFSRTMLLWLATAVVLLVVPAHVVWLLDRRSGDVVGNDPRYLPGIFQALAWSAEALLNQASGMPRRNLARVVAIVWLFAGVVFISLLVAQLTASITLEQFRGVINGPDDLAGKAVATQAGSTSVDLLRRIGAPESRRSRRRTKRSRPCSTGRSTRWSWPRPRCSTTRPIAGRGRSRSSGPSSSKRDLGFVVPLHSPWHRRIDSALVALHDDGTYERLREKWFGKE